MNVSKELQKKVEKRVNECIAIAEKHFNRTIAKPSIHFDVRGTVGGYYQPGAHKVRYNPVLLNENVDYYIETTVAHEVAHAIDYYLLGSSIYNTRRHKPHGYSWKNIMRILGVPVERCHHYNVDNAQVRVKNKYEYRCKHCGTLIVVGPKIHEGIRRGQVRWHKGCGRGVGGLEFVRALGQVTYDQAAEMRKPAAPTVAPKKVEVKQPKIDNGSKYEKAKAIVLEWSMHSKTTAADMIRYIEKECGMSKAGASTYYYKARKELGY